MKNWMKPVVLLLMVSGTLLLNSCGGNVDDEDVTPITPLIVGEWEYESADISITINDKDIFDYYMEYFELSEEEAQLLVDTFEESMNDFDGMSWTFTNDGKYVFTDKEGNESGTWALSSDKSKLTVTSGGESEQLNVNFLTQAKLKVSYTESFEEDMDEDGTMEVFGISIILELKK
ncbi:MAG: lipocalin family protein [Marinoscillum sp.]